MMKYQFMKCNDMLQETAGIITGFVAIALVFLHPCCSTLHTCVPEGMDLFPQVPPKMPVD